MMDQSWYFNMSKIWFDALQNYLYCCNTVMGTDDKNKSTNLYVDGDK